MSSFPQEAVELNEYAAELSDLPIRPDLSKLSSSLHQWDNTAQDYQEVLTCFQACVLQLYGILTDYTLAGISN